MKYRCTENITVPFTLHQHSQEIEPDIVEMDVNLRSLYSDKTEATFVKIIIPLPQNTALCKINNIHSFGKAKYTSTINSIVWKIKKYPGSTEAELKVFITLINSLKEGKEKVDISIDFEIPIAFSEISIKSLEVAEDSNYETSKWIKYISKAGTFAVRT